MAKTDWNTGDILGAEDMNTLGSEVNSLGNKQNYIATVGDNIIVFDDKPVMFLDSPSSNSKPTTNKNLTTKAYVDSKIKWRVIIDETLLSNSASQKTFSVDINANPFALSKIKIYLIVPASTANNNGFISLFNSTEKNALESRFGNMTFQKSSGSGIFLMSSEVNYTIPNYLKFVSIGSNKLASYNPIIYPESLGDYSLNQISKIGFYLNSGVWEAGTRFIIEGIDI